MEKSNIPPVVTSVNVTDDGGALRRNWYVARVRMNCERRAEAMLRELGLETYIPLRWEVHQWSDRKKKVQRNLLPLVVFVKALKSDISKILRVPLVFQLMSKPGSRTAAIVPEKEIEQFKFMVGNWDGDIEIVDPDLKKGMPVRVMRGPLKGIEGVASMDSEGKTTIFITIEALCCASVEIPVSDLAPI